MKVLIIDDHTLFRGGLRELLCKRGIEVDTMENGEKALEKVADLQPDIILLDVRMPKMGGLDVLRKIVDLGVTAPVVMLSTSRDELDVVRAFRYGAQGYLLKDMEPDHLVQRLRAVMAGETVVSASLASVLAGAVGGHTTRSKALSNPDLTPREMEVLCHVAGGQSNKVIARQLGISDGTVKLHVKAILKKLSVHSRVEAAVIAVEQGLCDKT